MLFTRRKVKRILIILVLIAAIGVAAGQAYTAMTGCLPEAVCCPSDYPDNCVTNGQECPWMGEERYACSAKSPTHQVR